MFGANIERTLLRESAHSSSCTVDHLVRSEWGEAEHTLMNLKRMLQKRFVIEIRGRLRHAVCNSSPCHIKENSTFWSVRLNLSCTGIRIKSQQIDSADIQQGKHSRLTPWMQLNCTIQYKKINNARCETGENVTSAQSKLKKTLKA